jgi:TatD DNase family protein
MLIDTHCHLDFPQFDSDREQVINRAQANGLGYIINIGSSLKGSQDSVRFCEQYDFIYASVGIHPHHAEGIGQSELSRIKDLSFSRKVVAIGETGLDFYKNYASEESQRRLFCSLIGLAQERQMPLIIHSRAASQEVLEILKREKPRKAVVHCFSGDRDFLEHYLDLGFYISFTCNITYKNAEDLRALVKDVPLQRLMLETDAPFLPPQEFRGKRNEPAYVKNLAEEIARIKNIDFKNLAQITTFNAQQFFNLGQKSKGQ